MATYKNGILGVFTGKVGTVVGSSWNGIAYFKSLPKSSGKTPTAAQLAQRFKFAMLVAFLKPLYPIINVGYQHCDTAKTPQNSALSYHLTKAITGVSPTCEIDYSKVVISKGFLAAAWNPAVSAPQPGQVNFAWTNNSNSSLADASDDATLVTYCPATGEYCYLTAASKRNVGEFALALPPSFAGKLIHCWMTFFSADQQEVSISTYAGTAAIR